MRRLCEERSASGGQSGDSSGPFGFRFFKRLERLERLETAALIGAMAQMIDSASAALL
jgi:hypothetical protein